MAALAQPAQPASAPAPPWHHPHPPHHLCGRRGYGLHHLRLRSIRRLLLLLLLVHAGWHVRLLLLLWRDAALCADGAKVWQRLHCRHLLMAQAAASRDGPRLPLLLLLHHLLSVFLPHLQPTICCRLSCQAAAAAGWAGPTLHAAAPAAAMRAPGA